MGEENLPAPVSETAPKDYVHTREMDFSGRMPYPETTNCISQGEGPSHGGTFDGREPSTGWSTERPHRRQRLGAAEIRPSARALALPARQRPARGTLQPGAWSSRKPTRRVVPVRCKPPSWSCRSPSRREGYGRGKSSGTGFGDRSEGLRTHPGNVAFWKMPYRSDREMDSKRHAPL